MEGNKKLLKKLICSFLFCAIFSGIFVVGYKWNNEVVKEYQIENDVQIITDMYYYGMEKPVVENEQLVITGWAVRKDSDLNYVNRTVLLSDDAGNYYKINTIKVDRGLTDFYHNGHNYDNGGIQAQCPINQLCKGGRFKVAFLIQELDGKKYIINFEDEIVI